MIFYHISNYIYNCQLGCFQTSLHLLSKYRSVWTTILCLDEDSVSLSKSTNLLHYIDLICEPISNVKDSLTTNLLPTPQTQVEKKPAKPSIHSLTITSTLSFKSTSSAKTSTTSSVSAVMAQDCEGFPDSLEIVSSTKPSQQETSLPIFQSPPIINPQSPSRPNFDHRVGNPLYGSSYSDQPLSLVGSTFRVKKNEKTSSSFLGVWLSKTNQPHFFRLPGWPRHWKRSSPQLFAENGSISRPQWQSPGA